MGCCVPQGLPRGEDLCRLKAAYSLGCFWFLVDTVDLGYRLGALIRDIGASAGAVTFLKPLNVALQLLRFGEFLCHAESVPWMGRLCRLSRLTVLLNKEQVRDLPQGRPRSAVLRDWDFTGTR